MSNNKVNMNRIEYLKPFETKNCAFSNLNNSQILNNAVANKIFDLISKTENFVSLLNTLKEIKRIQTEREIELEKIYSTKEITMMKLRQEYEISTKKLLNDLEKFKEYSKICDKVIDKALENKNFDEAIKVLSIWKDLLKEKIDGEV